MTAREGYRFHQGTLTLSLHVQPGAPRTEWAGWHGQTALRLKVAAPARDDLANQACIRFLAQCCGVAREGVLIVQGARSRHKVVRISPVNQEKLQALLLQWNGSSGA